MVDQQNPDDVILHQDAVEDVVEEIFDRQIDGSVNNNSAIADAEGIQDGDSLTETDFNLLVGKVNDILVVLRNSKIIPQTD